MPDRVSPSTMMIGLQLTDADSVYTDVNSHWAKKYIVAVSPYIDGITDTLFEPDCPVTREVVVSTLGQIQGWAISNVDISVAYSMFSDFGEITPKLQNGIARAVKLGISNGYPDGTFRPQSNLTRAEACTLIYRAFRYEIDTVAANLYDFCSMVMDNDGTIYYINGSTIYNTENDKTLDLNSSFGEKRTNPYLAYDSYHDIVYLIASKFSIYDISDFDNPALVLDQNNCPALAASKAGSLAYYSTVSPQIAVIENGALLIPFNLNGTWMVNPQTKTVTKTSNIYSFAYPNLYAKVVGDAVIKFDESKAEATVTALGENQGYTITLAAGAPWNNGNSVVSRNGLVYFYEDSIGLCAYAVDGSGYVMIDRKFVNVKDYNGLDYTNIWCLDVSENNQAAFYDNSLKCIRLIRPAQ